MHWVTWLSACYEWLVNNGLWRTVISIMVGYLLAHVFSWHPVRHLRHIEDMLDTDKPGGLTEVVRAISRHETAHEVPAHEPGNIVGGSPEHR